MDTESLPAQIRTLDPELQERVKEFRAHPNAKPYLDDPKYNDFFLARARKLVVDDAVEMFVNRVKWREEVGADKVFETFPTNVHYEKLVGYWPGSQHWQEPFKTKDGSVLLFEALGKCDPSVIDSIGIDTLLQFHIWSMENLERIWFNTMAEKGYWPGFVMIEDLGGIGMHTFSAQVMKLVQNIVYINQNYYPDMLRKAYIINVPSVFYMFWKGISLWMEARTLAKLEMINGGAETIKDKLAEIIDPDQLPVRLTGTNEKDIPEGGPVGETPVKLRTKVANYIDVPRSDVYAAVYYFDVGEVVSWEFKTKFYDIGFTVNYLGPNKNNKKEIVPMQRHDANLRVISGTLEVMEKGYYQLLWDNTFSWTRSKMIKFNVYKGATVIS